MASTNRSMSTHKTERRDVARLFRQLRKQPMQSFPPARAKFAAPCKLGVYIIRNGIGEVEHVGGTPRAKGGIKQRLNDHLNARSSFVNKHLAGNAAKLRDGYTFQCLEVPDARKRVLLEAMATALLCPLHLGLGDGVS